MITEKNKEEIEKILKDIENVCFGIERVHLIASRNATIKTSIQWCEDEIEKCNTILTALNNTASYPEFKIFKEYKGVKIYLDSLIRTTFDIEQLQTHLTWLKEQEKEL